MSWLEDFVRADAERVVGPGYGWAGGRFGWLLTTVIRWAGGLLAVILLGLWFKDGGGTFSSKSTPANSAESAKPKGGF